jgi:hypothetical protein
MKRKIFIGKKQFTQLNLSSVEHVWVEYHVAESFLSPTHTLASSLIQEVKKKRVDCV